MNGEQEELPYGNPPSSGHAGSDTSQQRAEQEDRTGTTRARQTQVLRMARDMQTWGVTVKEVRSELHLHHGQASSALSNLHKAGRLARLTSSRERCKVYVLPGWVNGRPVEEHGNTATTTMLAEMYALLNEADRIEQYDRAKSDLPPDWFERAADVMKHYENTYGSGGDE